MRWTFGTRDVGISLRKKALRKKVTLTAFRGQSSEVRGAEVRWLREEWRDRWVGQATKVSFLLTFKVTKLIGSQRFVVEVGHVHVFRCFFFLPVLPTAPVDLL